MGKRRNWKIGMNASGYSAQCHGGGGGTGEARYAYYRRCQIFRRNGEQCKAPAEKGAHICYAHAGQQAMALRRKQELTAVLAEAARGMCARGRPEFGVADIFMDFNAIQVTIAVMTQALIDGRIDCKTAGRLAVGLQTASKLLRLYHREHRGRQSGKTLTTNQAKEHKRAPESKTEQVVDMAASGDRNMAADVAETANVVVISGLHGGGVKAEQATGPPEWLRAA
jgi:hypothetical protein